MLKLFYGELGRTEQIVALARDQVAVHKERLALYEGMAARYQQRGVVPVRTATLTFGLILERHEIAFWEEIAAHPPISDAPQADAAAADGTCAR